MQKIILVTLSIIALSVSTIYGKESSSLNNLKRPEFNFRTSETKSEQAFTRTIKKINNSRFAGVFQGTVTVHYTQKLVTTTARLTIDSNIKNISKSHYNYYVIPAKGSYTEYAWELDGIKILRTVTISGDTIYITDIINYKEGGGNSQVRTLVFSPDLSALTFLKTEFDDERIMPSTGHIIGRFKRIK
ncbi:hypothetical protein [Desulfovibrio sp. UCD-KL4C]|uniref:hypothetical protein n=1 Tax=Desulfovibrio sp. UCD-KL4C TaxID=2578120 RepID=UPI0025C2D02D|nr:hypothetical protein [Desulfovibrio sp. UCD-KL4C]